MKSKLLRADMNVVASVVGFEFNKRTHQQTTHQQTTHQQATN